MVCVYIYMIGACVHTYMCTQLTSLIKYIPHIQFVAGCYGALF